MNLSWLQSVMMGFVSGLSEPLPLSAEAHRGILRQFFGIGSEGPLFQLLCHVAVLVVILMTGHLELNRLHRTAKLLKQPPRRRSGNVDLNSAGTLKLLRSAVVIVIIGRMLSVHLRVVSERLYLLFPMLIAGGVILWMPTMMRTGNKDGRHLAPMDGMMTAFGAALSAVPGISFVGAAVSVAAMRCADRRYALRFAWILLVIDLVAAIGVDLLAIAGVGFSFALSELLRGALGAVSAAAGAYLAVQVMHALMRRGGRGISGFCFYNWGLALLCMVLFLLV